jgi:RND family efflux transporter MFP subunit
MELALTLPAFRRIPRTALLLTVAALGFTGTLGCSRHTAADAATPPAEHPPKRVRVVTVAEEPWPATVRVQGSLLADEDAVIGSKLAGRVEKVNIDLGSVVKRGASLVEIDCDELKLRVQQAEAMLEQACAAIGKTPDDDETTLQLETSPPVMLEQALVDEAKAAVKRAEQLLPTRAMTDAEYETFVAQLKTAEARYMSAVNAVREQISLIGVRRAELALSEQQLNEAVIVAPFDALVDAKRVSPGAYVQLGQAVASLVRIDRLRFTAGVPESRASRIEVGKPISIQVAGAEKPILVEVSRVSPTVVQSSRSVRIEADVPNPDLELQAGLFAQAEITIDADATALAVPATAVTQFAGVQKVWVVRNGQSEQATVHIGRHDDQRIEILDGVKPGDVILVNAADGHDGPVIAEAEPASPQT